MAPETLIIDGSNVAHEVPSEKGQPRVSNIVAMVRKVRELGYGPIVIVDASLRHEVDDPDQLEALMDQARVLQAPAGTDADFFILQSADQEGARIVSNDRFRDHVDRFPWVKERRVPYMLVRGEVQLYEPKLPPQATGDGASAEG